MPDKKNEEKNDYIETDWAASWIDKETDSKLKEQEIQKIISFFIIHAPCSDSSSRSIEVAKSETYNFRKKLNLSNQNFFFMADT